MNHYTVYKITNKINGRYYIGKHKTKDLDDDYLGSGKLIRAAIKKYGIDNFEKEILFVFETEDEMNKKEAEIVSEELIASGTVYNLCPGGNGGFGYINENGLAFGGKHKLASTKGANTKNKLFPHKRHYFTPDEIRKGRKDNFRSKKHTEETKRKIGEANSKHQTGERNSQFGTMWITNGTENRKIKKDLNSIPEGWYKGRTNTAP